MQAVHRVESYGNARSAISSECHRYTDIEHP